MLRILCLSLFMLSLSAFVYAQEKQKAYKFFEYEKVGDNLLSEKIKSYCNEIDRRSWIGWIINFGTPKKIVSREKQIRDTRICTKEFPSPRIIFEKIEDNNKSKTELWIVPPGEKLPTS